MSNFRPAGMSDDESDSDDDYRFFDKPARKYYPILESPKRKIEDAIQNSIKEGDLEEVKKIIGKDLNNNVNNKLDTGWTPLLHACNLGHKDVVDYLLEIGADPNMHCDSVTPVMRACSNTTAREEDIIEIVHKLIEKGAILNIGDKYGETPLMKAIASGKVGLVKKLLENKVNIEMRDQKGWTAIFEAVHNNQLEIIELLVAQGARLTEVDRTGRTLYDIATSLDYQNITDYLDKYLKTDEDYTNERVLMYENQPTSWHDYYPGCEKGKIPNYESVIPQLLYGMNCEKITHIIRDSGMTLREFLLMEEKDMLRLGIDLPYERQRLKYGLKKFHLKSWQLNSVAGLYAAKKDNFSVLDCLATLGTHLQQVYILEATLQYTMRAYKNVQDQIKYEPPTSPVVTKLKASAKKMLSYIKNIRTEIKTLKTLLIKINKSNPPLINMPRERTTRQVIFTYCTHAALVCSIGIMFYKFRGLYRV